MAEHRELDVLIPHYEDPAGLDRSLRSVFNQTWPGNIRALVVDDGSSPENQQRAGNVVEMFNGPRRSSEFFVNDGNRGRPYTRNKLLYLASAKYISWLDAGDLWYDEKISYQFAEIDRLVDRGFDVRKIWVTCNYDWRWFGENKKKKEQNVNQDQLKALFSGKTVRAYLWTLLGHRESFKAIGPFDIELPRMQDLDFFIRFVRAGGQLVHVGIHDPLCCYEKSDVGKDASIVKECAFRVQEKHHPVLSDYGRRFLKNRRCDVYMLAARFAQNNDDVFKKSVYIGYATFNRPLRAVRTLILNRGRV